MSLTEDEIDDILYAARINQPTDLKQYVTDASQRLSSGQTDFHILSAAVDAETGNTALHYAAANGHPDIIVLASTMIDNSPGSDAAKTDLALSPAQSDIFNSFLNRPNAAGNTALHWAALNGHLPAVQMLVKLGANPALTNNMGHDAVFEAERNDKEEVVKWFLAEVPGLEQAVGSGNDNEDEATAEGMEVDADGTDEVTLADEKPKMDGNDPNFSSNGINKPEAECK